MSSAAEMNAFLAAIAAEPGEDTPRLVFADWLEEQGYPDRAEMIRVQCEEDQLPYTEANEPAQKALEKRATALVRQFQKTWLAGRPSRWSVHFLRGLLQLEVVGRSLYRLESSTWGAGER